MINLNDTSTLVWVALGLLLLAVAVAVAVASARRARQRRTAVLRDRFGSEYDRTRMKYGARAERLLEERAARVDAMHFRDLTEVDRARFTASWTAIQAQFVDDPQAAVGAANGLVKDVMRARGYAADVGFEQRAADLSVDHADMAQHYRAARALAQRGAQSPELSTEDLRQAFVHYRAVFADLLVPNRAAAPTGALRPATA